MIEVRTAPAAVAQAWSDGWRDRLVRQYGRYSPSAAWVARMVDQRYADRQRASEALVLELISGDRVIGTMALAVHTDSGPPTLSVSDIIIEPEHRRRGHATAALAWASAWGRERAGSLVTVTDPADAAHLALFRAFAVRAQTMLKHLSTPDTLATGVLARPMADDEFAAWRSDRVREYTDQIVRSGLMTPHDAAARAAAQFDQILPDGLDSAQQVFRSVIAGGEQVGTVWLGLGYAPDTSWVYSVDVPEQHRGKGLGRAAMLVAEQVAASVGDTQVGLNVFGDNAVAIGLYDSMGYQTVHQHRSGVL